MWEIKYKNIDAVLQSIYYLFSLTREIAMCRKIFLGNLAILTNVNLDSEIGKFDANRIIVAEVKRYQYILNQFTSLIIYLTQK